MNNNLQTHFGAFFDKDSKVLILGSFPSKDSLEAKFFYQNCTNRFWCVMEKIFGAKGLRGDINAQKDFLKSHHIALLDIWVQCHRADTSADKDIDIDKSERANLNEILNKAKIEAIFTTIGQGDSLSKWRIKEWIQSYFPNQNIDMILYPLYSTSARSPKSDKELIENYKIIKEILEKVAK